MDVFEISEHTQRQAWQILEETCVMSLWESIGAEVYIVGSLKSGLLMHRDIDMHVYSDRVCVEESFAVISRLMVQKGWRELQYRNLLDTEEECVEWHALYEDHEGNVWKFDMIHIRKGSRYDGVVERVTEEISCKLTPELRRTILQIKYDVPEMERIPGIEVYYGVFTGGVRSYEELLQWREENPMENSLGWKP